MGIRILVADDEIADDGKPTAPNRIIDALEQSGYSVDDADTIERAIARATESKWDIAIVDLNWPNNRKGWEVVDAIRDSPANQSTRVIMYSGYLDQDVKISAAERHVMTVPKRRPDGPAPTEKEHLTSMLTLVRALVWEISREAAIRADLERARECGTKVFIGHGHSSVWRELKDFLQDRMGLEWEEFNREPVAGIPTTERLQQMLDASCIGFLVMTAEDQHADDSLHARENVIHEVGLFQGRLGFRRAIIVLEEGCSRFSNIAGLTEIHFPKGKIAAVFEEVRRVLEREEMV